MTNHYLTCQKCYTGYGRCSKDLDRIRDRPWLAQDVIEAAVELLAATDERADKLRRALGALSA